MPSGPLFFVPDTRGLEKILIHPQDEGQGPPYMNIITTFRGRGKIEPKKAPKASDAFLAS